MPYGASQAEPTTYSACRSSLSPLCCSAQCRLVTVSRCDANGFEPYAPSDTGVVNVFATEQLSGVAPVVPAGVGPWVNAPQPKSLAGTVKLKFAKLLRSPKL